MDPQICLLHTSSFSFNLYILRQSSLQGYYFTWNLLLSKTPKNVINLTWQIRYFKSLHQGLRLIVPHMYIAIVQTCQHPWLSGMHIHTFNTVWTSRELALVTRRYSKWSGIGSTFTAVCNFPSHNHTFFNRSKDSRSYLHNQIVDLCNCRNLFFYYRSSAVLRDVSLIFRCHGN